METPSHFQVPLHPSPRSEIIQERKRGAAAKEADTKTPLMPEASPRRRLNHFPSMARETMVRTPWPQNLTRRKPPERTMKATWTCFASVRGEPEYSMMPEMTSRVEPRHQRVSPRQGLAITIILRAPNLSKKKPATGRSRALAMVPTR